MLTLLSTLAFAQERACDPVPRDQLETHLVRAEEALGAARADEASTALDHASEAARCLAEPIPKNLLARIAWGRAELAAADMDEEVAWTWLRLARDAGMPEPPPRIAEAHPVRRIAAEARDALPMSGPTGVALHPPKKGTIYADGVALASPELRVSTPHLLQSFDKEGLPYLGSWQQGAVFPSSMLVPLVAEGHRERRTAEAGDELPPKNWKPARDDTEAAYRDWIKKHPKGPWLQDAEDGIDDLRWNAALADGSELAVRQYIHDFPDGLHVDEAEFFVEDLEYRKVLEDPHPKREAWVAFLEKYPDGSYAAEAHVQMELMDWEAARTADDAAGYRAYVEKHPNGRNTERGRALEEERAFAEARKSGLDSALEKYLDRWPEGVFAREARAILGEVEFLAVTVDITGEVDEAVKERVRTDLAAELEKREMPVLAEGEDPASAGHIAIALEVQPGDKITNVGARFTLSYGDLKAPLNEMRILSKILPDADAGAMLGELIVTNLRDLDRWQPPKPEGDAKKPAPAKPAAK
ncbi:MAG: hypothetical protein H6737_28260 [Alphaproteobacteria bacterium]|nr:hypothetical protein [Alphaproteobacteria bacterium]